MYPNSPRDVRCDSRLGQLDEHGVKGAYFEEGEQRKYYRLIKSLDVSEEPEKVQEVLKQVFHNLAMPTTVQGTVAEDSFVASWLVSLKKIPNLHFEDQGEE